MTLLLGVGNAMRGDDGVGPEVVARVARLGLPGVEIATESEPVALLNHLRRPSPPDVVLVVDATAPRGEPGRVRVHQVGGERLARRAPVLGSHGFGLADVVELARVLGLLPSRLTVIGVEAASTRLGDGLTVAAQAGVDSAVQAVRQALGRPER